MATVTHHLFDSAATKDAIDAHHGPDGVTIDLIDGNTLKFRITAKHGNTYEGRLLDGTGRLVTVDLNKGTATVRD